MRSLTSTTLKRNKKSAEEKKPKAKVENTSQIKEKDLNENTSKINSGKSSNRSKHSKVDEKQRDGDDLNVKSANSKILKPITLKLDKDHGSVFKERENIQNKTETRENLQNSKKEKAVVAHDDITMKKGCGVRSQGNVQRKNSEVARIPKENNSDPNAEVTVDDTERATSEDGNRKMSTKEDRGHDAKRLSNKSLKEVDDIKECKYAFVACTLRLHEV